MIAPASVSAAVVAAANVTVTVTTADNVADPTKLSRISNACDAAVNVLAVIAADVIVVAPTALRRYTVKSASFCVASVTLDLVNNVPTARFRPPPVLSRAFNAAAVVA